MINAKIFTIIMAFIAALALNSMESEAGNEAGFELYSKSDENYYVTIKFGPQNFMIKHPLVNKQSIASPETSNPKFTSVEIFFYRKKNDENPAFKYTIHRSRSIPTPVNKYLTWNPNKNPRNPELFLYPQTGPGNGLFHKNKRGHLLKNNVSQADIQCDQGC